MKGIWTQRFGRQNIQRARCLFLPAFRRVTAARDLAGLVEPLAIHLDPRGVLLALGCELHRIAHLFLPILGENDLRGGRVAMHDDQWIADLHVESGPLARGRCGLCFGNGRAILAFPGGRAEPHDDDAAATALREAEEEIGLDAARVEVLGSMPTYTTPPGATSFDTPPLPADETFYFVVRATDEAGNTSSSNCG